MQTGILATIGHTPLIQLHRLLPTRPFALFAKLEAFNPGGSIKDRPALHIVTQALAQGLLHPGATVIESSSGNMAIGLAQACAYLGLRFLCVVDAKTTAQNLAILRAYGAEIECITTPDPRTGEFLQARIDRVQQLLQTIPHSWWANQYANPDNAQAHHQTMHEIVTALDGRVDYLFCATSTCGTLRGCAEYVRAHQLPTVIYGVDALGSVIFGRAPGRRWLPGHGASRRPELFQADLADHVVHVTDGACVAGCQALLRREAILAGGSSGAVIAAVARVQATIPAGATCVAILCDRGERYLDTIYDPRWVAEHIGDLPDIWEEPTPVEVAGH